LKNEQKLFKLVEKNTIFSRFSITRNKTGKKLELEAGPVTVADSVHARSRRCGTSVAGFWSTGRYAR